MTPEKTVEDQWGTKGLRAYSCGIPRARSTNVASASAGLVVMNRPD
jgi:hypothetical protein